MLPRSREQKLRDKYAVEQFLVLTKAARAPSSTAAAGDAAAGEAGAAEAGGGGGADAAGDDVIWLKVEDEVRAGAAGRLCFCVRAYVVQVCAWSLGFRV